MLSKTYHDLIKVVLLGRINYGLIDLSSRTIKLEMILYKTFNRLLGHKLYIYFGLPKLSMHLVLSLLVIFPK